MCRRTGHFLRRQIVGVPGGLTNFGDSLLELGHLSRTSIVAPDSLLMLEKKPVRRIHYQGASEFKSLPLEIALNVLGLDAVNVLFYFTATEETTYTCHK